MGEIFPAGTDSRFLRALGVQAIGFSPMAKSPILLHEHNEALSVKAFLYGISVYEKVLDALATAPKQEQELLFDRLSSTSQSPANGGEKVLDASTTAPRLEQKLHGDRLSATSPSPP